MITSYWATYTRQFLYIIGDMKVKEEDDFNYFYADIMNYWPYLNIIPNCIITFFFNFQWFSFAVFISRRVSSLLDTLWSWLYWAVSIYNSPALLLHHHQVDLHHFHLIWTSNFSLMISIWRMDYIFYAELIMNHSKWNCMKFFFVVIMINYKSSLYCSQIPSMYINPWFVYIF